MQKSKNAFTMIELVFVIVVLGILAAIAVPRLAATRTDAQISKGRADISSIRSAIITERQSRLITGDSSFITGLNLNGAKLFDGVLTYGIVSSTSDGHWATTGVDTNATATYNYNVAGINVGFTYTSNTGVFDCTNSSDTYCAELTQ